MTGSRAPHPVAAVVFDLDGVLVDSEELWSAAREQLVRERGGTWPANATRAMMGMSSPEWSRYLHDELHVDMSPVAISSDVVARLAKLYEQELPLLAGATDTVASLAARWPLGLASSSNREIIDLVLDRAGLARHFDVTVSSEEVARGKPAPDVYLEAVRRLDVPREQCVAIEDSENGLRAAAAAHMLVVAVPNRAFPPVGGALEVAAVVVDSLDELTPSLIESL
jgi:HAD superfamily hydrolase (TIGR01509 family)